MRLLCILAFGLTDAFTSKYTRFVKSWWYKIILGTVQKKPAENVCELKYELLNYDPNPNEPTVVVASDGKFRVQVMTENLFRFEYSAKGTFENRPTISVVNRNMTLLANVKFNHYEQGGKLFILTSKFNITYVVGSGLKTSEDLRVVSLDGSTYNGDSGFVWSYGMTSEDDPGNLLGTYRTLDQTDHPSLDCKIDKKPHCVYGLISRNGWAIVDDSDAPILDCEDWWSDDDGKYYTHNSDVDLYLFAHNINYTQALTDYSLIGGKIPIFPRYAHGIWWTRWYYMTDNDVRDQIRQFEEYSIPLDVLVLDMNWHKKNGWTGYTFDPNLFPSVEHFFRFAKDELGLAVAANLHDADGINTWEDLFQKAATAIEFPVTETTKKIPFDLSNKTQTLVALEDVVLKSLENDGMDFWWIDWQQGENAAGTTGGKINPTIWTDKIRVTNPKRQNLQSTNPTDATKRGMVLARFGGLGNHRYQVGFSGDVKTLSWDDLAYQPYFSQTASNVGYGFWSHDIVGPGDDHELYVRWLQWGCVSGIMRNHDRGMSSGHCADPFPMNVETSCPIVQPWKTPSNFFHPIRDALQLRQRLIPYIYSQTRAAFETGVSLLRPMYYDNQKMEIAYNLREQYYFGNKMVIRPIVEKSDATTMATVTIWLPPGGWYEVTGYSNRWIDIPDDSDGLNITAMYALEEIPMFVHEMAVIPYLGRRTPHQRNYIGLARSNYEHLDLKLFLCGMIRARTSVYQDDGETTAYLQGDFSELNVMAMPTDVTNTTMNVTAWLGGGLLDGYEQSYTIMMPNVGPPKKVSTSYGKEINYRSVVKHIDDYSWRYDPEQVTLLIDIPPTRVKHGHNVFEIFVEFDMPVNEQRLVLNRVSHIMRRGKVLN